jgi:RNA polymerase sigma-70 factor (ECF subfamily)
VEHASGLVLMVPGLYRARGARRDTLGVPVKDPEGRDEGEASSDLEQLGDAALVEAARAGRREAFDQLVVRHRRAVYQVCYRFTGNHEDASDLSQEAFLRAYRGLASFRGSAAFSTWLYRIAVNACLSRSTVRRPQPEEVDPERHVDATQMAADVALARTRNAARVRAAVAQLPDRQRATVILRVYHDLPHDQIAKILGSSVGAVKANLFHALRNLRRLLGEAET